jgi:tRNA-splicing ligase RtcB (3'-phosphate/5'-hydroxy nucleic acid ligase)
MKDKLKRIDDNFLVLPKSVREGMNVDAKILADNETLKEIESEAIKQLTNVAMLPGIVEPALAMPDAHWGYGLPMGAVAAFDETGVISAGMTGFDINCGVRMLTSNLTKEEVKEKLPELIDTLFKDIPCGVGAKSNIRLDEDQLKDVLVNGCNWALDNGYGVKEDLENTEENGCMKGADPSKLSELAIKRGKPQLGTLGSGNHYLEIQEVNEVYDKVFADKYDVKKGNVVIMIHCGSRGIGHQIASDYLKIHEKAAKEFGIILPDRQLACAPINSKQGQDYFAAMKCAVNYAFTNRMIIGHLVRKAFEKVFSKTWKEMNMKTVYGVAHNICKKELHNKKWLYVHRKGATRSFPDQPVLIGGSMGTSSWLLKGTETAMKLTFGSTAHGAGRVLSRKAANAAYSGQQVQANMKKEGRLVKAANIKTLSEEAPGAYKNVLSVIESLHNSGVSLKVAKLLPIGTIKG